MQNLEMLFKDLYVELLHIGGLWEEKAIDIKSLHLLQSQLTRQIRKIMKLYFKMQNRNLRETIADGDLGVLTQREFEQILQKLITRDKCAKRFDSYMNPIESTQKNNKHEAEKDPLNNDPEIVNSGQKIDHRNDGGMGDYVYNATRPDG